MNLLNIIILCVGFKLGTFLFSLNESLRNLKNLFHFREVKFNFHRMGISFNQIGIDFVKMEID